MMKRFVPFIAAGVALVVVGVWYVAIYSPKSNELSKAKADLQSTEASAQTLKAQLSNLRGLEANRSKQQAVLQKLSSAVPATPDLASFILQANDIATQAGVSWLQVSPGVPAAGSGGPTTISLTMQLEGGFYQVFDYLSRLENMQRLVLVDTVDPGHHRGVFPTDRRRWLASALEETRERRQPTLVVMHHQPVPPEHAGSYPNTIGIVPVDSMPLFELLARHQQVKAVLIGHTHRNRVRRYAPTAALPFAEVNCVKDYPGGFAVYELYDDGTIRQEVRRTASARALAHSTRCRDFFGGRYRDFALGSIDDRCWVSG